MFSTESQSSLQKHLTQGGGLIYCMPAYRHKPLAKGWSLCPKGCQWHPPPKAKPSEPGQVLLGFPAGRRGSVHVGTLGQVAEEDTDIGTGLVTAVLPFCGQR